MADPGSGDYETRAERRDVETSTGRRVGIGVVIALGIVCLAGLLVIQRAHDTLLHPDFYVTHLEQVGVFERLSGEFVPATVERGLHDRFPNLSDPAIEDASDIAGRTLSSSWFESRALIIVRALLPWLAGETDTFVIDLPVDD